MKFTYENQGINTYLVYQIDTKDEVDTMSLGMLTNNKITGLIPAIFTQMDKDRFIKYNVSAKVSVKQFFTGAVNRKRLIGVFTGIVNAMMSAEEYMINPSNILLDLDYIYTDVSTCETNLICLPIAEEDEKTPDLGLMFKSIVFSTQFDQTENCDYVARIINYLNSSPIFSLEDFKKVLDEISGEGQKQKTVTQSQEPPQQQVSQKQTVQPMASQQKMPIQESQVVSQNQQALKQQSPTQQSLTQQSLTQQSTKQQPQVQTSARQAKSNTISAQKSATETTSIPQPEEKRISMMTLLTHYSKENRELYKKQREEKKNATKAKSKSAEKTSTKVSAAKKQVETSTGFAIPGQSSAPVASSEPVQQNVNREVQSVQQMASQVKPAGFGETTVLNAENNIGETTVLSAMNAQIETKPMLYRQKTNEKILINKPVFRIGKERSYVDYFIGDNTAISRSHANILIRDNEYYVVDTNSKNHTYVNGIMIQSNEEIKLTHGTKIQLANEEFEFRMY